MTADRAVVSLATKSRSEGLLDLERSLDDAGFRGARLIWRPGEWPAGAPAHEDVPFAFKAFCLEEARRRGHGAALWVDADAVVVGSLDPLFEQIEEHGYVLFDNRNYRLGQWASDEALAAVGLAREAALLLREVNAAALGLRFSHPVARQFLDGWLAEARKATVFRGTAGKYDAKRDLITGQLERFGIAVGPATRVLEIGCGVGYWTAYLAGRGVRRYTGNDITPISVATLSQRYPDFEFVQGDAGEIPLPPLAYDLVLMIDVTQHITDDAAFVRAMRNVWRAVTPGGAFVVTYWDPGTNMLLTTRLRLNRIEKPRPLAAYTAVWGDGAEVLATIPFNDKHLAVVHKIG